MASFTTITVKGIDQLGVTIDEGVGLGGAANKKGDVMLVQALMNYILPYREKDLSDPGIIPPDPPEISGAYDEATDEAIEYYQRSRDQFLMNFDRRIDPPSYGRVVGRGGDARWVGRNLKNINGTRLMTMTMLHFEARAVAKRRLAHGRYAHGLRVMFPQIMQHMKGADLLNFNWLT